MRGLVKKIHMYTGLLSFTALVVYGVAGLHATFRPAYADRPANPSSVRHVAFDVPGGLTDKEVADRVFHLLDMPLTGPIADWALRRDGQQNLLLNFYTVNGNRRVTVLEDEGRLRVEEERVGIGHFAIALHALTLQYAPPGVLPQAWAWYNELAIWSLLLMVVSGLYLWLASRPGHLWARTALVAGGGSFVILYWLTR